LKQLFLYDNIRGTSSVNALQAAEAIVKIKVGYSETKYDTFVALTLYDSKCRECNENILIKSERWTDLKEVYIYNELTNN